jgi:hypothetical protein
MREELFHFLVIDIITTIDLTLAASLAGSVLFGLLLFKIFQFLRRSTRAEKEGADLIDHIKQQSKDDKIFHSASCKALNRKTKVEVRRVI